MRFQAEAVAFVIEYPILSGNRSNEISGVELNAWQIREGFHGDAALFAGCDCHQLNASLEALSRIKLWS